MKSQKITLILLSAALAGCGNHVKYKRMASDTTYSHDGHMIITTHVYSGAGAREGESGVTRGGFGSSAGSHGSGHGAGE
jgi:hypothetical protein